MELEYDETHYDEDEVGLTLDEREDFELMRAPSNRIDYRNQDFDVLGLVSRLNSDEVIIPRIGYASALVETSLFQRGFVWNKKQMDSFIESLLLEYPVPSLFLVRQEDRRLLVLDGQQRLETLRRFYEKGGKPHRLNLPGSPYDGMSYEELPGASKRTLDNTYITSTIIMLENKPASYEAVYDVFARLNSGGTQLTPHEIRMALYNGHLMGKIDEINRVPEWRILYGKTEPNKRFRDHELVLRIIALFLEEEKYTKPLGGFLNEFSARHRNEVPDKLEQAFWLFEQAAVHLSSISELKPFSLPKKKQLNAARADSMMVAVMRALRDGMQLSPSSLSTLVNLLNESDDYLFAVTGATSDDSQVHKRIALAQEALSNVAK